MMIMMKTINCILWKCCLWGLWLFFAVVSPRCAQTLQVCDWFVAKDRPLRFAMDLLPLVDVFPIGGRANVFCDWGRPLRFAIARGHPLKVVNRRWRLSKRGGAWQQSCQTRATQIVHTHSEEQQQTEHSERDTPVERRTPPYPSPREVSLVQGATS